MLRFQNSVRGQWQVARRSLRPFRFGYAVLTVVCLASFPLCGASIRRPTVVHSAGCQSCLALQLCCVRVSLCIALVYDGRGRALGTVRRGQAWCSLLRSGSAICNRPTPGICPKALPNDKLALVVSVARKEPTTTCTRTVRQHGATMMSRHLRLGHAV